MTVPVNRGRGRPAALPTGVRASSLTLRLSEAERAAWMSAAGLEAARQGRPITLAEWVRGLVNGVTAAKRAAR